MTDPLITRSIGVSLFTVSRMVPVRPDWRKIEKLDAILITHGDYDHLDSDSIRLLHDRFPYARIFVPEGARRFLRGIPKDRITELPWHQASTIGAIRLTAVPAIHGTRRPPYRLDSAHWAGYILRAGKHSLYFSGDVAQGNIYKAIRRKYGSVKTAFVPIGGYKPQWFNRPYHMTPEQAYDLGRLMGASEVIGMHWAPCPCPRIPAKSRKTASFLRPEKAARCRAPAS